MQQATSAPTGATTPRRRLRSLAFGLVLLIGALSPLGDAVPSFAQSGDANSIEPSAPVPGTGDPGSTTAAPAETPAIAETPTPDGEPDAPAPLPQGDEVSPLADQSDTTIGPLAVANFCTPTQYYTLDRPGTDQAAIRRISFNDSTNAITSGIRMPATGSLTGSGNNALVGSVNALGVTEQGDFYFTAERDNRLSNPSSDAVNIYRYAVNNGTTLAGTLTRMALDVRLGVTGVTVVAGAVNPVEESYYFAYFAPGSGTDIQMHLFRYAVDFTARKIAVVTVENPDGWLGNGVSDVNGDFAFDGDGNLHVVMSNNGTAGTAGHAMTARIVNTDLAAAAQASSPVAIDAREGISGLTNTNTGTTGYNGIAFTGNGKLIVEQSNVQRLTNPFTFAGLGSTTTITGTLVDLASCMTPPTITVQKNVIDRHAPSDQFALAVEQASTLVENVTTAGDQTGIQPQQIGPTPVLAGVDYRISETLPANADRYDSRYECRVPSDGDRVLASGNGRDFTISFPASLFTAGHKVSCVFTNETKKPKLRVSKESDPVSGTTVNAGDTVRYLLTFDNSEGTADASVDHVDHLRDVLDDADFDAGSIRYGDGSGSPSSTSPLAPGIAATAPDAQQRMAVAGTVPAGEKRVVAFTVTVKANSTDANERQDAEAPNAGYLLRNYLTPRGEQPPGTCQVAPGADPLCTEHPVRAWTVRKDSQPPDGAMLHTGGNVYYRVTVTNLSGDTFRGITVQDDLTQTLAATVWDEAFPNLVPVPHGISFYDANGQIIGGLTLPSSYVPKPSYAGGKWTMQTLPFDLPANARTAVVGYVVEVGYRADISDPTKRATDGNGADIPAAPNATWVNTAQATAATVDGVSGPIWPNRCSANSENGAGVPPGDVAEYHDCKTWHMLGESYFHIQKNSTEENAAGTSVEWNIAGVDFILADTRQGAADGVWSRWLCRASNGAPSFDAPGSATGQLQIGADSPAHADITAWNAAQAQLPEHQRDPAYPRPQCGLFYEHTDTSDGQPAGTWHAQDLRGGDAGVADWRTDSVDGHGTYWLQETRAPEGHQLLAKAMQFWVAPDTPTPEGLAPGSPALYDSQGRLSFPVGGDGEHSAPGQGVGSPEIRRVCTNPNQLPAYGQPSCVMPTGWLMQIYDAKLLPLPFSGGTASQFLLYGCALLLAGLAAAWWWLRRGRQQATLALRAPHHNFTSPTVKKGNHE